MNKKGYFGKFGGSYVPETLVEPLRVLAAEYERYRKDRKFNEELGELSEKYAGRPTPLYHSKKLSEHCGCRVYLKREDLCHTGAHKINNAIGQALLAKKMKKSRIIAETGAGQHGVAAATVSALFGIKCQVFMGAEDISRQSENVCRMKLLGADIIQVDEGTRTLKEAVNATLREWTRDPENTYYLLGSCVGPHPYPMIVRDFQSVIGREVKKQIKEDPTHLVACVGGGSNSIGLFYPFFKDRETELIGVEAEGAASLGRGRIGVLHGSRSYVLYDDNGQIVNTHSVAPGLDYSGVGPEHAYFKDLNRARYCRIGDAAALKAFRWMVSSEGIIPALESSHAVAWVMKNKWKKKDIVVICLSGRGEKDLDIVMKG
ncbi:MAG: tryptophan synthase subunit beta [Elusimicrobia bacterium]|nr:tryptophan synthase subunit beta [Elusimicrobiota bacterium]